MLVQQILSSKAVEGVLTLHSDAHVKEAAAIMSDRRIGTIVISDDDGGTPMGILSERDIVREIGRQGPECLSKSVKDIMTRDPVTCTPADSSDAVLSRMTEGRFRHMPVIEGDRMIGLISIGDVVKARLAELSMEKNALEGMIMGH
ncbi:CBS domain-containing protein [Salibaculum sp.]|jgi:CBS domain-containing protein|uniref:CBS domain-containing protein n=1 Tax=Salibaculum sp. TaxID=2855480 RepID=UPI002B46038A|nr:CBS domain-containing protein [Salibaculum sp.]HKL70391.1 CBS domain-containing protein [Salibaculum sp.]